MPKNRSTILVLGVITGSVLACSCSSNTEKPKSANVSTEQTISSTPPFKTREPDHYQAVRTLTITDPSGNSVTTKTSIARYEALRREETEGKSSQKLVFLDTDQGRMLLLPEARIYAEVNSAEPTTDPEEADSSPERLLHPEPVATSYQQLGTELVSGRNATKYRVVVNSSTQSDVSRSETIIWIDETLGMPVRSEMTSADGSRTLMEMSEIALDVDKSLFRMPAGYQKVATAELRRRISGR